MTAALTPDELGEVGETLFRKLCAQAKLVCNKSERDRTGWDFRVELPMESAPGITLDQRAPRVCQVQLKTTAGESGTRVQARLSSIERLAKDPAPAVVIILRMTPNGREMMGFAIHLINKDLSRILHRLRIAEKDGRADVNRMSISFDYRKAQRFKPTAEGLSEVLREICGEDAAAYAENKRHQLAHLGYEDGRGLEAEALIWIEDAGHLNKILSGSAPLKPIKLKTYDRRFGIRVPYEGALLEGVEEIAVNLPSVGPCTLIIRHGPLNPAALFECEAFLPLPVEGGPILVIRHPTLDMTFTDANLHIESVGNFNTDPHGLDDWIVLLRGLSYLAEGSATVELEFLGKRISAMPAKELDGPNSDQLLDLLNFVEGWKRLTDLAGVRSAANFSIEDIWNADNEQMSLDMLLNPAPKVRLDFDVVEGVDSRPQIAAIYFNTCEFAGAAISYSTKVTLTKDSRREQGYVSSKFELLDIRPAVQDLEAYASEIAIKSEISVLIDPKNVTVVPEPLRSTE